MDHLAFKANSLVVYQVTIGKNQEESIFIVRIILKTIILLQVLVVCQGQLILK